MISKLWRTFIDFVIRIGIDPGDDDDARLQKEVLIVTTFVIAFAGIIWGFVYLKYNEPLAASIPLAYSAISAINLFFLNRFRHYVTFRFIQLLLILLLPFFLLIALGGFINSSAVIVWSLLAPLGALMCCKTPQSVYWFAAYLGLLAVSGIIHPYLRIENNLPPEFVRSFFFVNIAAVSGIAFAVLNYFVRQKDLAIDLMRKHRELEQAYVQQEVMLRQSEKLATLGKLSAGIAHELNNPASAVQRNINLLQDEMKKLESSGNKLRELNLSTDHLKLLESYKQMVRDRVDNPVTLNPLTRSEREDDIEEWLVLNGVNNAGSFAPMLVDLGYGRNELTEMAERFSGEKFPAVAGFLCNMYSAYGLLVETGKAMRRITDIVKALKSYSYLDQAPVQSVDIHDGLDDTLVILQGKLNNGITIRKEYTNNLPRVDAYGSELNQVWTNLLDNAIDALNEKGEIVIKTSREDEWVVVEIRDDGPGIPEDILPKVFDPFVTTKPPGKGTGLGLNISHNIIVQKHSGSLSVESVPGATKFIVKVPIQMMNLQEQVNEI